MLQCMVIANVSTHLNVCFHCHSHYVLFLNCLTITETENKSSLIWLDDGATETLDWEFRLRCRWHNFSCQINACIFTPSCKEELSLLVSIVAFVFSFRSTFFYFCSNSVVSCVTQVSSWLKGQITDLGCVRIQWQKNSACIQYFFSIYSYSFYPFINAYEIKY